MEGHTHMSILIDTLKYFIKKKYMNFETIPQPNENDYFHKVKCG